MVGTLLQEPVHGTYELGSAEPITAPRPLDFQQTIPRAVVHRAAVSEVFVTDMNTLGPDRFEIAAQWPRRHSFFGPGAPHTHDPMLHAETCRQAGLLIAHRAYGVPLGHGFLSDRKQCTVDVAGLVTVGKPVDVVLRIAAHDLIRRGRNVVGGRMEFECFRDGHRVGAASESWRCMSPAVYRRLRGEHHGATPRRARTRATVYPALVGRALGRDVLVAATETYGVWSLQIDPDHEVMFDHPVDHVPGMVLTEAARQAALLTVRDPYALPVRTDFEYRSYVEFDSECLLRVEGVCDVEDGVREVRVSFRQGGAVVAAGTLAMRSL
ncbi:ScbA/BarX family gamma-butyrolactone biosynthesis protein [Actinokineospora enzanensis]|uniref:ScbA/BarX family gamma-butyrolactone biosynthesis protein n=1 Tax=Actinokineospora enzanensis TaxID=155975 RepID=UPI000363A006|nr:ScbA/BarX family gamma-butyrolactone biosynthesis protein [Actinokineospora enzanensis]